MEPATDNDYQNNKQENNRRLTVRKKREDKMIFTHNENCRRRCNDDLDLAETCKESTTDRTFSTASIPKRKLQNKTDKA